ncbi:hypothetical protein MKX03_037242 [Papaver bracteatum]|nr:hypothetical protein MKX03_037242 [Papaver bracteatum]
MLFPKIFQITWGDNTSNWKWLKIIEPSASGDVEIEVPELVAVCWLSVHGKLDISKLSPGVNYEIVFVAMFREDSSGWGVPVELWLELSNGEKQVQKVDFRPITKSKWIEIHVGVSKHHNSLVIKKMRSISGCLNMKC